MVNVPLFINAVEIDLERAAVRAGWVLSAMTAAMALFSYVGGRATERTWYKPPMLAGVAASTAAYAWMGATWSADTSYGVFIVQLALLGAGFGLTVAPTTSAVVAPSSSPPLAPTMCTWSDMSQGLLLNQCMAVAEKPRFSELVGSICR